MRKRKEKEHTLYGDSRGGEIPTEKIFMSAGFSDDGKRRILDTLGDAWNSVEKKKKALSQRDAVRTVNQGKETRGASDRTGHRRAESGC